MRNCCTLLCLLTAFVFGCTYEPDGSYVNQNIHPPPAEIPMPIDIETVAGSEFALVVPTYFRVTIDREGRTLRSFRIYVDDQRVDIISYPGPDQYIFYANPATLSDGSHEYKIEVQLSSGSGSIAEASGLEYYDIEKKLIVTVDNSLPSPVTGISADMVNGHMTLHWDKPEHHHYFYQITRSDDKGNYQSFTINDPNVTEYIDEGYLGGPVTYRITLQSANFVVPSEPLAYDFNSIEAVSTVNENGHLKLKWTMHSNFGDEVFVRVSGRNFTKDFPAISGEEFVDTVYLGDIAKSNLKLLRTGFENDGLTIHNTNSIGTQIKAFDQYSLVQASNKLILNRVNNGYRTYRYNVTTVALEDSITFFEPILSSQDGNHQYFSSEKYLRSFNPLDFSAPPTSIYLEDIYRAVHGSDLENPVIWGVTNDNFLALTNRQKIVTFDLNNKQLWGTEINGGAATISGDGSFMLVTGDFGADATVYKREATDWEEIGKVPFGERVFFSKLPDPKLISSINGVTKVYDLESAVSPAGYFSEIASAPIAATSFDVANNWVISEVIDAKFVSTISIYSLDGFALVSMVKARVTSNWLNYNHFVGGGRQLVTSGFIKKLE